MKIRCIQPFVVAGGKHARKGEIHELPETVAQHLIQNGRAAALKKGEKEEPAIEERDPKPR